MRGQPIRAPQIGADAQRRKTCGDGCGLPPARTARGALQIPRIESAAEYLVAGFGAQGELRQIGLAQENAAAFSEPAQGRGIGGGHELGKNQGAARRAQTLAVKTILGGKGNAVQRTADFAAHQRVFGFLRLLQSIGGKGNDGVYFWIDGFDALQVSTHYFHRRKGFGANLCGQLGGIGAIDLLAHFFNLLFWR